jgi:hypothetical protein
MGSKNYHSAIRIKKSEKDFLDKLGISIMRVTQIGFASLGLVAQSDACHPCIYVSTTGKNRMLPAGPHINVSNPPAHCCPACPVLKAMPKMIPATTETPKQKESIMIDQDRCGVNTGSIVGNGFYV